MPISPLLTTLRQHADSLPSLRELFDQDPSRAQAFSTEAAGLFADHSKQRWDSAMRGQMLAFVEQLDLPGATARLLSGATVNHSEGRPALHSLLRAPAGHRSDARLHEVVRVRAHMQRLVEAVHAGRAADVGLIQPTDVVSIGIGGSDLGPRLIADALPAAPGAPRLHFLANVDGHALDRLLPKLDPLRTLIIVISKSFTTHETHLNAGSVRQFLLQGGVAEADLAKHCLAVSANVAAAQAFGIAADRILPMWDWVGGRYSLWSAVGLGALFKIGWPAFDALLDGAHALDQHFESAPLAHNLPVLQALVSVLNRNVYGSTTQAVLSYDDRLALLPEHLQQLRMESNGKRVSESGAPLSHDTIPVLFGGLGTNVQHSFMQALHQGTQAVPVDFIGVRSADHDTPAHHRALLANLLAQSSALMLGTDHIDPQRVMPGNRPSTTLLLERVDARSLGALVAMYEQQTYVESRLWGINPFDQWGVELGKKIAVQLLPLLESGDDDASLDGSTRMLLQRLR